MIDDQGNGQGLDRDWTATRKPGKAYFTGLLRRMEAVRSDCAAPLLQP